MSVQVGPVALLAGLDFMARVALELILPERRALGRQSLVDLGVALQLHQVLDHRAQLLLGQVLLGVRVHLVLHLGVAEEASVVGIADQRTDPFARRVVLE